MRSAMACMQGVERSAQELHGAHLPFPPRSRAKAYAAPRSSTAGQQSDSMLASSSLPKRTAANARSVRNETARPETDSPCACRVPCRAG